MPTNKVYWKLSKKWAKRHRELQKDLWEKHSDALKIITNSGRNLAVASLGGIAILSSAGNPIVLSHPNISLAQETQSPKIERSVFLISDLSTVLPKNIQPLTDNQNDQISNILSRTFNMKVSASLDGKALNTTYGYIGAEQHLARFPGDSINSHFDSSEEENAFYSSGMAPGLGAWGYFAPSSSQMTKDDSDKEKYYIAVQTFLSKDFQTKFAEYRDFYKYRKMLVVNPQNGKAIVADIADAGPSPWTGKQLGGSPEVMKYLERVDGAGKGPVLYYFIDDSENIPLGPVKIVQ